MEHRQRELQENTMKPMWNYYGAKYKMARRLGPPQRDHVIEPFAGSACYSCYWEPRQVTIVEIDPVIYGVWAYMHRTSADEIMKLPIVDHVNELPAGTPQEAKWLVGFNLNHGNAAPANARSVWGKTFRERFWGPRARGRIASQVDKIRHWKIVHGSYADMDNTDAHWHIDPPYQGRPGRYYKHNEVDYAALAAWCRSRKGFVHVCEGPDADWLPFVPFSTIKGTAGSHRLGWSAEVLYQQGTEYTDMFRKQESKRNDHSTDDRAGSHRSHRSQAAKGSRQVPGGRAARA